MLKDAAVSLLKCSRPEAIDAMGVPASKRLRRPSDFLKVRSEGTRILCGPFIFQALVRPAADTAQTRFGVIASRRVGNAVKRQRGKRIFREIFRLNESALPKAVEVVVVLRGNYDQYTFANLEGRYLKACSRISEAAEGAQS